MFYLHIINVFINKRPFEPSQEEGGLTDIEHVTFIGGLTIQWREFHPIASSRFLPSEIQARHDLHWETKPHN